MHGFHVGINNAILFFTMQVEADILKSVTALHEIHNRSTPSPHMCSPYGMEYRRDIGGSLRKM